MGKFKVGDRVIPSPGNGFIFEHWDKYWAKTEGAANGDFYIINIEGSLLQYSARVDGKCGPSTTGDNFIHAPLTIEAGKFYRARDGRKVGPIEAYDYGYWHVRGTNDLWRADGTECVHSSADLIAEWVDGPAWNTAGFTIPVEDGWYATELGRAYADGYAAGLKAGNDEEPNDVEFDLAVFNSVARLKRRGLLSS